MRVTSPNDSGVPSATLVPPPSSGRGWVVLLDNTGPNDVWVSDSQSALDASVDSTGTPQNGAILHSGDKVTTIVTSGLWTRSAAAGSFLDILVGDICVE